MSELFEKEMNAQKESLRKSFRGSHKLPHAHEKVCDENERNKQTKKQRNKKKRCARKNVFGGRKPFIRRTQRTGENDLNMLQVNDSGHIEGTICLVNG